MPYWVVLSVFVLLLAAMALGATVTLRAVRATQADSASLQQFSKDVASIAMENLIATEREASRDRSLVSMAETQQALNLTVGQMYHQLRQMQTDGGIGRVPRAMLQHGETAPAPLTVPPQSPLGPKPTEPLPPEGFSEAPETPRGSTPAAERTRDRAFAERT